MQKLDRAILVALNYQGNYEACEQSLDELEELAKAVQIKTVDKVIQSNDKIEPKFFIGSGKVLEIKQMIDILNVDMVIFDDTLSPAQIRNLEEALEVQIFDRAFLILQIFALRAQTKQAMLEVALAQKLYMLPRLAGMGKSLSRQGGGSFNAKGPGETKLETDRRRLNMEITRLRASLEAIKKERGESRKRRSKNSIPVVALVGYTNAGKSSLMNHLSNLYGTNKTEVFEKDMLFATLDTKSKRIQKDNQPPFILIDTVGFISKLPPELIKSFESTLADIATADLILHIVDGKNYSPLQINFTKQVIKDLGLEETPRLLVVTKRDLLVHQPNILEDYLLISNKTGEGMNDLYQAISAHIYKDSRIFKLLLPFDKGSIYERLKSDTTIIETNYTADGMFVKVVLTPYLYNLYKSYIIN
ncbi:GTPase HflX [Acholeplasma laidlawii]|uniref:GTPase HflX n=1 Tax=Acholeplasma laidlawii TaxID=2148 RepID=UPI0018C2B391|nr:GTPase HflX [Acholeplasma laidlawii]MBG0762323.1 GTPase HflX [Acholeplasma laidlawii]